MYVESDVAVVDNRQSLNKSKKHDVKGRKLI